jgi:hypothetical protein
MPILDSELDRIRAELGHNLLNVGAEPYIGVTAVFSQIVQRYLREGLDCTSSTTANTPGYVTLTLDSVTGISVMSRVAIDVDEQFEMVTVRAVNDVAKTISVITKKKHPGTYPVTIDGGLQIVRECLAALVDIQTKLVDTRGHGTLKAVDEVEFYDTRGKTQFQAYLDQAEHWRDRLARHLGLSRIKFGGGGQGSVLC